MRRQGGTKKLKKRDKVIEALLIILSISCQINIYSLKMQGS